MTKFMTLIAGAALAGATAMPAFADDPFVSTQDGEGLTTEGAVAGGAAALAGTFVILNDDSSSSSSSSSTGSVFSLGGG